MTVITKTNQRDELKQISDALTAGDSASATNAADIATNVTDISNLDTRVTTLEGGVNGTPPTALHGCITSNGDLLGVTGEYLAIPVTASETAYDTWKTILSVSGSGVISYLDVYQVANTSSRDVQCRLTIDSVVVYTSDADLWKLTGENNSGTFLVGSHQNTAAMEGLSFSSIPFVSSFLVDFKKTENAAGTVEMGTRARYHLS